MTTAQLEPKKVPEERCVALWRFGQLRQAGYGRRQASTLAQRRDVDLHLAVRLRRDGCPVDTALRILL
jgi:hypothetical protein